MEKQGKLIVIEGVDSSGKATQTKKLVERLRQEGREVETYAFPRHKQKFFGELVDRYLNNEFGEAVGVDPRLASLVYACDRWEVKDLLRGWLDKGKIVVVNRYATSNMGHQASKVLDFNKRDEFLNWLNELEFGVFNIPKPDLALYLDVSVDVVYDLMIKRGRQDKEYMDGHYDGHEKDMNHLVVSNATYQYLCGRYDYWQRVECMERGKLLDIDRVHERVWGVVRDII